MVVCPPTIFVTPSPSYPYVTVHDSAELFAAMGACSGDFILGADAAAD
jgi:hypothetical protein